MNTEKEIDVKLDINEMVENAINNQVGMIVKRKVENSYQEWGLERKIEEQIKDKVNKGIEFIIQHREYKAILSLTAEKLFQYIVDKENGGSLSDIFKNIMLKEGDGGYPMAEKVLMERYEFLLFDSCDNTLKDNICELSKKFTLDDEVMGMITTKVSELVKNEIMKSIRG